MRALSMHAVMLALCAIAFVCSFVVAAHAQNGGLQITPVIIEIPAERSVGSFRLHNGRDRETAFEASAFVWTQVNGENTLTPAEDVIVAPSTFITPAGGDQIIRLGIRAARDNAAERSYRIVLRELPDPNAANSGFRLIYEMSMPLFVTPHGARGVLWVQRGLDASGAPIVVLRNNGAARLQLSDAPNATALDNLPRYLLPGAEIARPCPPGAFGFMSATTGDTRATLVTIDAAHAPILAASH